jgi:adenylate cyclase class 2
MPVEIELKAWVKDPEEQKKRISALAEYTVSFEKEDSYWFPRALPPPGGGGPPSSGVRIREESAAGADGRVSRTVRVTCKSKELRDGIEINEEGEFEVSDRAAFEGLLKRLGLERGISKKKRGWAWVYEGVTAELCHVEGLGWFAELEILADNDRAETVAAARERLLGLLGKIGIGEDRIEGRYYTEMLRAAGKTAKGPPEGYSPP